MLTTKQKLILILISGEPGIKGVRKLVTVFERHDFPADMTFNLKPLLDSKLIEVSHNFDNWTPSGYEVTDKGREYLTQACNDNEILDYLKKLEQPNLIKDIAETYIEKIINNER